MTSADEAQHCSSPASSVLITQYEFMKQSRAAHSSAAVAGLGPDEGEAAPADTRNTTDSATARDFVSREMAPPCLKASTFTGICVSRCRNFVKC